MAEQLLDSLVSPTTTTAEAVVAGTTTDFDVASAAGLPASGTFRLLLKGAADDGSDDALATVGTISGVNCASVTWLENGQTNFDSGTEVELVLTAAGVDAAIDDRTAAYLPLAGGEMTGGIDFDTSGGGLGLTFDDGAGNVAQIVNDGYYTSFMYDVSEILSVSIDEIVVPVPLIAEVGVFARTLRHDQDLIGTTYNLDLSDPPSTLIADQSTSTINLPSLAANRGYHNDPDRHTRIFIVIPRDITSLTIVPYTSNGAGSSLAGHDRLNSADPTWGTWNLSTDGPQGPTAVITTDYSLYVLETCRWKNSASSGHGGSWVLYKVAGDMSF